MAPHAGEARFQGVTAVATASRARSAVLLVFACNGAVFASLASRLPDLKSTLHLTPGQLGATLLLGASGSVLGLPLSGAVIHRVGARSTVQLACVVVVLGYTAAVLAAVVGGSRWGFAAGLFVGTLAIGPWDVAMNLEGAGVERALGRSVMPLFHAAFSIGTVLAALVGALLAWLHTSIVVHVAAAAVLGAVASWWAAARFLPRSAEAEAAPGTTRGRAGIRRAWLEPRTLLIGVMVLAAAFMEGTANDWVAIAFHEGHQLPTWAGVLAFALFLASMTAGRVVGTRLLDRLGRVPLLRALFVLATAGSLLVVFGAPAAAYAGAVLWGLGASLGFPVGMSAAADDPQRAPARMSVVSTVGYVAFLVGPALLGWLGDHVGVLRSLLVVGVAALLAGAVVPAAREPGRPAPVG